ncbi:MAG: hypothetical protein WCW25_04715 [Patescibacteria group bacterium]|jgi:hypothetical protein
MGKTNLVIALSVAIVIAGAGGFYGGMQYEASKSPLANFQKNGTGAMRFQGTGGQGGGQGAGGGRMAAGNSGGFVSGEILKKDDKTVTVKLPDGGSKTVYIADTTTVSKSVDGVKDDLTEGVNVMITGTANSDGSVLAEFIQIR